MIDGLLVAVKNSWDFLLLVEIRYVKELVTRSFHLYLFALSVGLDCSFCCDLSVGGSSLDTGGRRLSTLLVEAVGRKTSQRILTKMVLPCEILWFTL